jgi:hypothetical protein
MTTQNVPAARRPQPLVGDRVELARYAITGATRAIYGQRIEGVVRVVDVPVGVRGRAYLVERELEHDGHAALKALVADYVAYARAHDQIPMSTTAAGASQE